MTNTMQPFAIRTPGVFDSTYLAEVKSVNDPTQQGRVEVRLLNWDGVDGQDGPVWARVVVPFAGAGRGAFFIPDVGDEVVVTFLMGDPRYPCVLGGVWHGADAPPETLSGGSVDRWTITGKHGSRIAIEETSKSTAKVALTTPGGHALTLDDGAKRITISDGTGNNIKIDSGGITITSTATVKVQAALVKVSASTVTVNAAMSSFSGVVKCDTLISNTVISSAYTPGAGNIW